MKENRITLRIIRPSSRETNDLLSNKISDLTKKGFSILYEDDPFDKNYPHNSSSLENRRKTLTKALLEKESNAVLCARGGYGASDLLPDIPWEDLEKATPKLLVGFSDISAIHSALYSKLNWPSIHGPMPATTYWNLNNYSDDTDQLLQLLLDKKMEGKLKIKPLSFESQKPTIQGKLFGGCFSVLTNLIGTPYFPKTLKDHILFWEDIDEYPGKIVRYLNQWKQSGVLEQVSAVILGRFEITTAEDDKRLIEENIYKAFTQHLNLPIFSSYEFGHCSPNIPIMIGADATIEDNLNLKWKLKETING